MIPTGPFQSLQFYDSVVPWFCGEALEQVAQRGSGGPIPGNIPDQVEQGSEQPGLAEDVPARCK